VIFARLEYITLFINFDRNSVIACRHKFGTTAIWNRNFRFICRFVLDVEHRSVSSASAMRWKSQYSD